MRRLRCLPSIGLWGLVGAVSAVVTVQPVVSQVPSLSVTPRVGFLRPASTLYATRVVNGDETFTTHSAMESARAVGLSLEWQVDSDVQFRATLDHSFGSETRVELTHSFRVPPTLGVGGKRVERVPSSLTALGLDAVLPLRLEVGPVAPYLSAGGGLTRFRFAPAEPIDVRREYSLPQSGVSLAWRVGAGLRISVLGKRVSGEWVRSTSSYFGEVHAYHGMLIGVALW